MSMIKTFLETVKPDILYHYTTQEGTLGVLNSKEIWATKVHYLNDSQEYRLALNLVYTELDKRKSTATKSQKAKILDFRERISWIEKVHIFVCSFTANGDLLSQWRGYGDSGSGYSIGFNGKVLDSIASKMNFILVPCVYDPMKQQQIIAELVDCGLKGLHNYEIQPNDDVDLGFEDYVAMLSPIIKDKSFHEEQEWRLISPLMNCHDKRFDFRAGKTSLIPYYKFPLEFHGIQLDIKKIVVGPSPHQDLANDALNTFLHSKRIADVKVVNSKIPYRNW